MAKIVARHVRRATIRVGLLALAAAFIGACGGGDSSVRVSGRAAPQIAVSGTLLLPNGSALRQQLAHVLASEALALTGNVAPAPNVQVTLVRLSSNGTQLSDRFVTVTDDQGHFTLDLPPDTGVDTCRFMVQAAGTRAFVYSTLANDIDYATDAAVSLVLQQVAQGTDLCRYTTADIGRLVDAIRSASGIVTGNNAAEVNASALALASSDGKVQAAVVAPFATPQPTATQAPRATRTPTPVPTYTSRPANTPTETNTPPNTATPTITLSPAPTLTPMPTSTVPPSSTPTAAPPTATLTPTPAATNTALPTNTPVPTSTLAPTSTPVPTVPASSTPTASVTPTSGSGPPLGSRTFTLSTNSNYYSSFLPTSSAGKPTGSMVLSAGGQDASGHATVTVTGPAYITIPITLASLTVCSRIDSCTGDLYCNGGVNVDETETLDSLKAGLSCVQDGTGNCPSAPANTCCSNACEGVGVGSGNSIVSAVGVNPGTNSGAGALLIHCTQRNVTVNKASGVTCSTQDYSAAAPFSQIYTTGTSTAVVLNHCAGTAPGNKAIVVPRFGKTGEDFSCASWTSPTGPGGFAFSLPAEQPSTIVVGDGAQAGVLSGH